MRQGNTAPRNVAAGQVSAVAAVRARAVAVPAWLWVAGIVVVSASLRIALAHRMVAPWIMVDELVYSELAKSFASHGQFPRPRSPERGYGLVYPVLIAPAWRLFGPIPDVYTAAKAINGVLMSLAAIPAYLLARRLLPARLSLAVAALTVLVPSMLYTGMLMTENAFYPLFLVVALVLVLTLERPTPRRQLALLALCAIAFETRAQAVALVAASGHGAAPARAIERRGLRRTVRRFAVLYGTLAGGAIVALLATAARGQSPLRLLGAYRAATSSNYTVSGILHYLLYHVAELDLYLGIVPFAALLAIWLAPRAGSPAVRAFTAASLALTVWLVAEVAAFASQSFVARIEERNLFYLAPLALIALLGFAADGIVPRGAAAGPDRGRPRRRAAGLHPLHALHHDERGLRHVRAAALVVGPGPLDHARPGALGRARRLACRRRPLRPAAAPLRARAARARRRVLRRDHARRRERPARDPPGLGRLALRRNTPRPSRLDRPRGSGGTPRSTSSGPARRRPTRSGRTSSSTAACTVYDLDGAPRPDPLPEASRRAGRAACW